MAGAQIVADSRSTETDLAEYGLRCAGLAAPGWDGDVIAETRTAPSSHPRLLFLGRLVRHKRPAEAVAAFRQVRRRLPDARLDVVGDGYLRASLEEQAQPGVTIHGFLPEAAKAALLDAADVLLVPCTREGWGIVAVEASSRGVPVVAYNVPGLCDSVADGQTGVLCDPVPDAMAAATVALLDDRSRWAAMAAAGPDWARRFTWEKAAADLMDVVGRPPAPTTSLTAPGACRPR
jgi:glycosyltransferase involved in cell wall biosynthesis